jgi:hypothetical protein
MISAELDREAGILHIRPTAALEESDFAHLAALADPYIEQHGQLTGLLLEVDHFPGWKNLAGMITHFRFVRDHHRKIRKVALVTDTPLADFAEKVVSHFVAATVRHFPAGQVREAKAWIRETPEGGN